MLDPRRTGAPASDTTRQRRNVRLHDRRTSVSLEIAIWDSLEAISLQEDVATDSIATMIDDRRQGSSLASSIRIFVLLYFRLLSENFQASLQRRPMPGVREEPPRMLAIALEMFARQEASGAPKR